MTVLPRDVVTGPQLGEGWELLMGAETALQRGLEWVDESALGQAFSRGVVMGLPLDEGWGLLMGSETAQRSAGELEN